MTCTGCGQANPEAAKFCNECGGRLATGLPRSAQREPRDYTPAHLAEKIIRSKSAIEGERKQLTVLFADVKGSMALAEQVDPEEWHRILDRFFRILSDGVHRFEGTVNQYTGDGIMALFGAPIAHEDHAQRACYAALHIGERLRDYADQVRLQSGLSFTARIGVNSGEAVVGTIGDDLRMDYTAQGHTVGLAQRMEQLAEPGRCYMTDQTAKLVQGYFEVRRLGDSRVKGVSGPICVYELVGVGMIRTRFDQSRARGLSGFVGRGDEMKVLGAALAEAVEGNGRVVTVVADAGVGKSRLCFEFVERCRARGIRVTESHAVAHGAVMPMMPVVYLLRSIFEIAHDDRDEVVRRKVAGALLLLDPAFRADLGLVFDLLGVADPVESAAVLDAQVRERRVRGVVCRIFRLWGGDDPAVLLVEDLHWIDRASEAIVDDIVDEVAGTSKLLLLNYRPEYEPGWNTDSSLPSRNIALAPLGPAEVHELLEEHIGTDPSASELPALIERQTGGNPFFVEEVVRSLVEAQTLVGVTGAYRLDRPVAEIAVPPTVQATIAGRIDRLDEIDKRTLQAASVIGRKFGGDLLGEISDLDVDVLDGSLQVLVDRQLIDLAALYPDREYSFRHALTRDVAYSSPLSEFRAQTHRAVARALERRHCDDVDAVAAAIAHHAEAAGAPLDAARWYARAGRWERPRRIYLARDHWRSVRRLAAECESTEEGASLIVEAGAFEIGLAFLLGYSRADVQTILGDTREVARGAGNVSGEIQLLNSYNLYLVGVNAGPESLAACEEVVELASGTADPNMLLSALFALALGRFSVGSLTAAGQTLDESFEMMDSSLATIDPHICQAVCMIASVVRMYEGRLDEAEESLRRADAIIEQQALEYRSDTYSSFVADRRGRPEVALKFARKAVEFAEHVDIPFQLVLARNSLGAALLSLGRFAEAASQWQSSLDLAREHGVALNIVPLQLGFLARALVGTGEIEEARRAAEEAVRIAVAAGHGVQQCNARLGLVRVLAAEGATEELEGEIVRVETLVDKIHGHVYYDPLLCEERAQLAEQLRDPALQRRELEEAARLHAAIGADGHADRIRKMLRERP